VVGALAVARLCESLGTPFTLGGVAWERLPIDPHPGPRPLAQIQGGRRLGEAAVLAGPRTATPVRSARSSWLKPRRNRRSRTRSPKEVTGRS